MLKIISNGYSKITPAWDYKTPGTIEDLKEALINYTLDPTFEEFGNFINRNPKWTKSEFKGCSQIFGNFFNYSHVFDIITDDEALINELSILIENNKGTKEYTQAKEDIKQRQLEYKENIRMRLEKMNSRTR